MKLKRTSALEGRSPSLISDYACLKASKRWSFSSNACSQFVVSRSTISLSNSFASSSGYEFWNTLSRSLLGTPAFSLLLFLSFVVCNSESALSSERKECNLFRLFRLVHSLFNCSKSSDGVLDPLRLDPTFIETGVDVLRLAACRKYYVGLSVCFLKRQRISVPVIRSYQGSFIRPSKLYSSNKPASASSPHTASLSRPIRSATRVKCAYRWRRLF